MNIYSVNNEKQLYPTDQANDKKDANQPQSVAASASAARGDTLEISPEAQSLQPIKAKIKDGIYNQPDIIKDLALKLNEKFPPETTAGEKA